MASTLQDQLPIVGEVDADVGAVDLLLDDQRVVSKETIGFCFTEVFIVIRPF